MKESEKKVLKGIKLLEKYFGERWYNNIDTKYLEMDDPCKCVLGHLFGNFHDGVRKLGIDYREAYYCGFDGTDDIDLLVLQKRWVKIIIAKKVDYIRNS